MVVLNARRECVSSVYDVLDMNVVRGMRGLDGVGEMYMFLVHSEVGGEGVGG